MLSDWLENCRDTLVQRSVARKMTAKNGCRGIGGDLARPMP
jgi:hypothetical protein